jgi:hypothetical protein
MVAKVNLLEKIYIPFLDGPPTENRASGRHKNRVLGEERGQGGGIVIVQSVVNLFIERNQRLAQLRIGRIHLLGKGCQSKSDCQS